MRLVSCVFDFCLDTKSFCNRGECLRDRICALVSKILGGPIQSFKLQSFCPMTPMLLLCMHYIGCSRFLMWDSPLYTVNIFYYNLLTKKMLWPTEGQN